ncbi:MAG: 23S rRNA (guanosine(2251)-2'-O)-methyltransferase RlmB [Bacilli bacterium]|nr:23S rRNA (guanosine(2251)-2'-O)-methyltransferase RlmB [Bacilli bacterium]MDD3304672.1 23S rRNA (guanosine(2251)-2'-O)-methyltransferase RlmB [Bacilli bacterium]MDD4053276.1 23S rRNA (guanosine(2251)-2'-O)-methyltransferase RlmB [Bacilli bacterium]MDD4411384.1 23S rRNA (guanosine(2251)-2'-O)-methyltransferase RlmB [Bacilli bacterium]
MIVYGKNVVKELLENKQKIEKAYIYENFNDQNFILALQKQNIRIEYKSKRDLDKLADGNHQGIIVLIPDYQFSQLEDLLENTTANDLIVLLDHLEDPHNLGAIIRTCEAAGVKGIILPKDRSVLVNSTVMKVSAGALSNVKICAVTNLNNTIKKLKENNFWIVGTTMDSDSSYMGFDYNMPTCLVIGNEGFGMSRLVSEACDYIVSIPMNGKINSLNASVAAGIMIYGILEKRRK